MHFLRKIYCDNLLYSAIVQCISFVKEAEAEIWHNKFLYLLPLIYLFFLLLIISCSSSFSYLFLFSAVFAAIVFRLLFTI